MVGEAKSTGHHCSGCSSVWIRGVDEAEMDLTFVPEASLRRWPIFSVDEVHSNASSPQFQRDAGSLYSCAQYRDVTELAGHGIAVCGGFHTASRNSVGALNLRRRATRRG